MYGLEVAYLPQRMVRRETVMEEVSSSKFTDQYMIEAYLSNFDGYSGSGDILSKFGMQLKDEVTLIISKERFEDFISPFLEEIPDDENTTTLRPREGDLIYFPLGGRIFEIKFVEHEQPFYQLGKTYVYELKCELFEYSDRAVIATSNDTIDSSLEDYGYIRSLTLFASGTQATASVSLRQNSGYVKTIKLIEDGYNYRKVPTVTIDSPPSSVAAAATATMGVTGTITDTTITNGGYYPSFVTAPKVTFSDPTGGGNETSIVKFGSRSYDGGDNGVTIQTPGLADRETGAIEFWLYVTEAPSGTVTLLEWGSNDVGNAKYSLYFSTVGSTTSLYWQRPTSDDDDSYMSIPVKSDFTGNFNRWNWIRLSQADSGANRVASHFFGDGTPDSSYSSNAFNTNLMTNDGVVLNPNGSFSDGQIFIDELRFASDDSITQPASAPTSTSKNSANTLFFQDGEKVAATGTAVLNSNNVITGITLTNSGSNYTSTPTITIDPPAPSVRATAVAITSTTGAFSSVKVLSSSNG